MNRKRLQNFVKAPSVFAYLNIGISALIFLPLIVRIAFFSTSELLKLGLMPISFFCLLIGFGSVISLFEFHPKWVESEDIKVVITTTVIIMGSFFGVMVFVAFLFSEKSLLLMSFLFFFGLGILIFQNRTRHFPLTERVKLRWNLYGVLVQVFCIFLSVLLF